MKKLFIYLSIALSVAIISVFVYSCAKEDPVAVDINDTPIPEGMMRFHLNNINPAITFSTQKSANIVPDDQDTVYISFRKHYGQTTPDFVVKVSPITDNYTLDVPAYSGGYDILICSYPGKLYETRETFDMPKHLWYFIAEDVGGFYEWAPIEDLNIERTIDVEFKRLSSNLIIQAREGTIIPDDIASIYVTFHSVFKNYHPVWNLHFGLYAEKYVQIWPNDDIVGNIVFENKCMGMANIEAPGSFYMVIRLTDGEYMRYDFHHKLVIDSGKTTKIDVDFNKLRNLKQSGVITWLDEEADIIIPVN